jgi:DNA-binding MarR family transcriptional regulator
LACRDIEVNDPSQSIGRTNEYTLAIIRQFRLQILFKDLQSAAVDEIVMPANKHLSELNSRKSDTTEARFSSDKESPLATSMGYQVRITYRTLEKFIQNRLVDSDVQIGMWYFLRILWIEDGLTQRELSRRVGTADPTTLEQLRNMEKRGLITRKRSKEDRRLVCVFLTPKGRTLEKKLMAHVDDLNAAALKGFSSKEKTMLQELLGRVRNNMRRAEE